MRKISHSPGLTGVSPGVHLAVSEVFEYISRADYRTDFLDAEKEICLKRYGKIEERLALLLPVPVIHEPALPLCIYNARIVRISFREI